MSELFRKLRFIKNLKHTSVEFTIKELMVILEKYADFTNTDETNYLTV